MERRFGLLIILGLWTARAFAVSWDLTSDVGAQLRYFPSTLPGSPKSVVAPSIMAQPRFLMKWDKDHQNFEASVFGRYDASDAARTHFDLSEFAYSKNWENFEVKAGVHKVFWGVTESQHLVDVVNQIDFVEDPTLKAKLGQPMVDLSYNSSAAGTFELLVMPYFRKRTFPGINGHFGGPILVDTDHPKFESSMNEWHPDVAVRWSQRAGILDIGLSHFYGTNRQPTLLPGVDAQGNAVLTPYYALIQQTGIDAQITSNGWLGKLEAITRGDKNYANPYAAFTAGVEYTFSQAFGANFDLGLLAEYLYDSRGKAAPTALDDDIFAGIRIGVNDASSTSLLVGCIFDRTTPNHMFTLETSRRFGATWKATAKGGIFHAGTPTDPISAFDRDDYLGLELTYYLLP